MNDREVVRVGVIGVGVMGERHARLYAQAPGAQLVGVYDADLGRAGAVAQRWGTAVFGLPDCMYKKARHSAARPEVSVSPASANALIAPAVSP